MTDSRGVSLQIMQGLLEGKTSAGGDVFCLKAEDDSAFVTMLIMTSLRHLVYIRNILKTLLTRKLSQQNITGQSALILGTTELLYMRTPDYAVINSYVSLVKERADRYVAGFVNAVLRKISQQKESLAAGDKGEFFPQSFRTLLRRSYSVKTIDAIEKAAVVEPALDITCVDADSAVKLNGIKLPLGTIRLNSRGKVNQLPDYDKGTWWVQDFSSALPVKILGDVAGKKVLELCAAPGGKTAQLISAGARVTCLDISEDRLKTLRENLRRLKLEPEKIICGDGLDFLDTTDEKYDAVVLDAPCSATGTLRRHPEVVHLKTLEDVKRQVLLQKQFLLRVDRVLAAGGMLLYCTCSLCREEGEDRIKAFLTKYPQYSINNPAPKIPMEIANIIRPEGFIRVLPQYLAAYGGADGFFIASLRKGV